MPSAKPTLRELLKHWHQLMNQHIDLQLKAEGLARSQFQVLWHVRRAGGMTQKQLVEQLGVSEATLSSIVDCTVTKGYVKRSPSQKDKRINTLSLTAAGQKKVDSIANPAEIVSRQMLRGFRVDEIAQLATNIERIIANLELTIKGDKHE